MPKLTGKTALITGGASGIGKSVVERFAKEGARVVIVDLNLDQAQLLADQLGPEVAKAFKLDITNESDHLSVYSQLTETGWLPNVVVANAGIQLFGQDAKVADLALDVFEKTVAVNLVGTFLTVKHAVKNMLGLDSGSIIVTGSPTAINGEGQDFTAYSSSKAGSHGMVRAVAAAYSKQGIRINTVVPGYTETALVSTISQDPELRSSIIGRIPLGRAGTPADVAGIMVYLASDDSSFATGAEFVVDGGMTNL